MSKYRLLGGELSDRVQVMARVKAYTIVIGGFRQPSCQWSQEFTAYSFPGLMSGYPVPVFISRWTWFGSVLRW